MEPQGYVDGIVADWQLQEDDRVGCELAGLVVYVPAGMQKKRFERSCDWLECRDEALRELLLDSVRPAKGGFGVVDTETSRKAWTALGDTFGDDYLHRFVSDTRMIARQKIGAVLKEAVLSDMDVIPAVTDEVVEVTPAMSFLSERALAQYLRDGSGAWKPSVRLSVRVSLEGAYGSVLETVAALMAAMTECGPVHSWRQRMRPAGARAAAVPKLRLVAR